MDEDIFCQTFNIFQLSKKTNLRLKFFTQKFTKKKHPEIWESIEFFKKIEHKNLLFPVFDGKMILTENSILSFYKKNEIIKYVKAQNIDFANLKKSIDEYDKIIVTDLSIGKIIKNNFKNDMDIIKELQKRVNQLIIESSYAKRKRLASKFKIKNTSEIDVNSITNDKILYIIIKSLEPKFCYL